MKFFIALAALIAVSATALTNPGFNINADLQAIIDAIHSPSTDPATAILLQEQLNSILGINVSPVIIPEPVIIPDPVIIEEPEVVPQEAAPVNSPLVDITININTETESASAPAPEPVVVRPNPAPVVVRPEPVPVVVRPEPTPVVVRPDPAPVGQPIVVDPVIIEPEPVLLPGILN